MAKHPASPPPAGPPSFATARAFYGAAVACFEQASAAGAEGNGEAAVAAAACGLVRAASSWAQMEYSVGNERAGRSLFRLVGGRAAVVCCVGWGLGCGAAGAAMRGADTLRLPCRPPSSPGPSTASDAHPLLQTPVCRLSTRPSRSRPRQQWRAVWTWSAFCSPLHTGSGRRARRRRPRSWPTR